ncbi:unnamed protein product [Schistocephalus solidus]|uniref:Uncharacterized protein n=1 Tax=Schistocephalus solidus TaxID=70667 RepID=A0A183SUE2_SCHSO|nr:unnamed protein product [Schistocephalus solidus]
MARKAEEIQGYADIYGLNYLYKLNKAAWGPTAKTANLLRSTYRRTLLTKKSQILKRWVIHITSVLNCPSTISVDAFDLLTQV